MTTMTALENEMSDRLGSDFTQGRPIDLPRYTKKMARARYRISQKDSQGFYRLFKDGMEIDCAKLRSDRGAARSDALLADGYVW